MTPRFPWQYLGCALLTAWLFDVLFWGNIPGIAFPIWILLILLCGWFLTWGEKVKAAKLSFVLAGVVFLTALVVFVRGDGFTRILAALIAISGTLLLAATFRTGNWFYYRISDYFVAAFWELVAAFSRPVSLFARLLVPALETGQSSAGWRGILKRMMPVVRGLLLALPVLLLLSLLLSSADIIFKQRLADLFSIFDLKRLPEYFFRLVYILFFTYLFSGLFLHAVLPNRQEITPDNQKTWVKPFLGITESGMVLALVDILFLFFVIIQVRYLFGGETNITETGFSYSEYARRGFGELVAVAILSLLLYLGLGAITKQESRSNRMVFSFLSILLMALVMVMLASAFQRLFLYESAYGFTRLRTYTHVFIFWLAALLLVLIGLEGFRRRGFFTTALLLSVFGFILTLGGMNVDGFIASRNITVGEESGLPLDVGYLKNLSADATPALIKGYLSGNLSDSEMEALGAELACRTGMAEEKRTERSWQSFNLAEDTELRELRANKMLWEDEFPVVQKAEIWFVEIDGVESACRQDWFMD